MSETEEPKPGKAVGNTPAATGIANSPEMQQLYSTIMAVLTSLGGDSMESLIGWSPGPGLPPTPYLIQIHVQPIAEEDIPVINERMGLMQKKIDEEKNK